MLSVRERSWMGWVEFSEKHGIPVVAECHLGVSKSHSIVLAASGLRLGSH